MEFEGSNYRIPTGNSNNNNNNSSSNNSNNNNNNTSTTNSTTNNNSNNSNNAGSTASATSSQTTTSAPGTNVPFVPLTRAKMRENLDNQDVININNIEEEQGTEKAAYKARMNPYKWSEEEFVVFSDLVGDNVARFEAYLYIRNRMLELWFSNVQEELTLDKCYDEFERHDKTWVFNEDSLVGDDLIDVIKRTFYFLDRTGRINIGLIESKREVWLDEPHRRARIMQPQDYKPPLKSGPYKRGEGRGRVIVLGAGLSGLMAARQLQKFGMEVIVLEARNRVGGRVHTYRKGNFIADLGPSALNGHVGNPLVVLGKQLELCVMELRQTIPLYENKINPNSNTPICHQVEPLLERAIEREYNKIMEGTRVLKNNYRIEEYRGQPFPVGMAVNWVMQLQEKLVKDDQIKHLKSIENLYKQLIESANKKLEKARIIKELHGQLCSIKDSTDIGNHRDKGVIDTFNRRCLARDLDLALKEYKLLQEQEDSINRNIDQLNSSPPSDTYLSLSDRRLLDWHFAELEYALGCPINKLGIHYEDDEEICEGPHWMFVHGFNTIVEAMKTDLDIKLGTAVKKVIITDKFCKVLTYQPDHAYSPYVEYTADAVLCTLPLGVLQDSIVPSQQAAAADPLDMNEIPPRAQKGYQPIIFRPPLPRWKTQSLNRLGCGNLNKIIMSFDKVFWDHNLHLFGVVNHQQTVSGRGEFFLFWHHGRTPTLTGLISGEAADIIEKLPDLEILERCLDVLRSIYGNHNVPAPKDYVVTKWRKDPWSRGAWSYQQTGATGADYENNSEPVVLDVDEFKEKDSNQTQSSSASEPAPEPEPEPEASSSEPKKKKNPLKKIVSQDEIPRLFFAGEHTAKYYFASAHGAILTGLREAGRIANIFHGCPYNPGVEGGVYMS